MGEFTQNLLKLTEFPFSYSLMGLIALIFGQGINPKDFSQIGPLLILTGFLATTLSVCDPVGALQRVIIKSRIPKIKESQGISTDPTTKNGPTETITRDFLNTVIFGKRILRHFSIPYIFAIGYSTEEIKRVIPWSRVKHWYEVVWLRQRVGRRVVEPLTIGSDIIQSFAIIQERHGLEYIYMLLKGTKKDTIETKWVTAEIDRITALVYFIVTISVFIIAIVLLPDILHKFSQAFQDIESIRIGILILSILALGAVSYMSFLRIRSLLNKASIVFNYLVALEAIKTEKERFNPILQEIERYLNNNDWILSEYWVDRIQLEYTEVFLDKVTSDRISRS
jgi:hypothetical protein